MADVAISYAKKSIGSFFGMTGMNGWGNYGSPYNNLQYIKDNFGFVTIRGPCSRWFSKYTNYGIASRI
jgi:hypothetical protein